MSQFMQPQLQVGDRVLYYSNPDNPQNPSMGFVASRPGVSTISILVFAGDAGFITKPSVRHKDDPFWPETESSGWKKWGCYEQHPESKLLSEVKGLLTKAKVQAAKKAS